MSCLPQHGRVKCTACFNTTPAVFNKTTQTDPAGNWRLTANPLAWGNPKAEIVVLGFSKGPNADKAIDDGMPHDKIAYPKLRHNVGKILNHVGLLEKSDNASLKDAVDIAIGDQNGRFHFGSVIRCGIEQNVAGKGWKKHGNNIISNFFSADFGKKVSQKCASQFLSDLPSQTKLVVMFGMGEKQKYVHEAYKLFQFARPGKWRWVKENVSYTDGKITVVHVEHFSPGHINEWMGVKKSKRSLYGEAAKLSVEHTLGICL